MILKVVVVVIALIVLILLYAAFLAPKSYRMIRSISIQASPAAIFPFMNDPKKFEQWNPFAKGAKDYKIAFEGPSEGVGAISRWESSSSQSGTGHMTIVESVPNERVKIRLDFLKPFEGTNYADYSLKNEGSQTIATWSIAGQQAFIPRVVCLFMNMEKMMGPLLDQGLSDLKHLSENAGK